MKGLFEKASEISRLHAEAVLGDPTLAAHLDANPGAVIDHANKLAEAVRPPAGLRVTFAPYIPQWWLARLFEEAGLVLKNDLASSTFKAEMTPEVYATLQAETVASIESDAGRQLMLDAGIEP